MKKNKTCSIYQLQLPASHKALFYLSAQSASYNSLVHPFTHIYTQSNFRLIKASRKHLFSSCNLLNESSARAKIIY